MKSKDRMPIDANKLSILYLQSENTYFYLLFLVHSVILSVLKLSLICSFHELLSNAIFIDSNQFLFHFLLT